MGRSGRRACGDHLTGTAPFRRGCHRGGPCLGAADVLREKQEETGREPEREGSLRGDRAHPGEVSCDHGGWGLQLRRRHAEESQELGPPPAGTGTQSLALPTSGAWTRTPGTPRADPVWCEASRGAAVYPAAPGPGPDLGPRTRVLLGAPSTCASGIRCLTRGWGEREGVGFWVRRSGRGCCSCPAAGRSPPQEVQRRHSSACVTPAVALRTHDVTESVSQNDRLPRVS